MRTTTMQIPTIPTITLDSLSQVTGGCHKQSPPPPPPQPQSSGWNVDVTVATGAQAAQAIQQG